jgi:hypothetical protein
MGNYGLQGQIDETEYSKFLVWLNNANNIATKSIHAVERGMISENERCALMKNTVNLMANSVCKRPEELQTSI